MASKPKSIWELLQETWPAKAAESAYDAALLPGQMASGMLATQPTVPGTWSDEDEARQQATQKTAMSRANDLAGLAMTGGIPSGSPGVSLTSGVNLYPPKAVGGYHATAVPEIFDKFKKSDRDVGTHFTTNPYIATEYSMGDFSPFGFMGGWGNKFKKEDAVPRTYPVVADIKKALKLPIDPGGNWADSEAFLDAMKYSMENGLRFPKGILRDLEVAGNSPGGWHKNLLPMLQDRGYDAVKYPHLEIPNVWPDRYNSYMVLDPSQIAPRFHPEGQEIIKRRGGLIRPYEKKMFMDEYSYTDEDLWPRGMLGK